VSAVDPGPVDGRILVPSPARRCLCSAQVERGICRDGLEPSRDLRKVRGELSVSAITPGNLAVRGGELATELRDSWMRLRFSGSGLVMVTLTSGPQAV